ncbi:terpenoid synthase [Neolentinus lepideus HHB14362 ss-1]|uniref:Terpene synthase n=1 Tax=Neolentinus lepideus HHB14362 ss-1 TaxID=1314782 RepID=A0A165QRL3_9AGAM|nr:terpenoid synthase [Neolentinus lepideus HHB14362 ss-1]
MAPAKTGFFLPNGLADWPWVRKLNPYYLEVKAESETWITSFAAFDQHAQNSFNKCDFSLLACLAYANVDKDRARTGCDLMNFLFLFDELSDVEDEKGVRAQADAILDALNHPRAPRPTGESILGEVARQFWARAIQTMSTGSQRRFISEFVPHVDAMVQQAKDRSRSYQDRRTITSYISVRRGTIAAKLAFAILEADMNLPDSVKTHPLITNLETCCMDMLILSNDMYSYNIEQAKDDDGHNIVTVVMHEKNTDVQWALHWVGQYYRRITTQFLQDKKMLPSWGNDIDSQVERYVDGLGNWARGHDQWCFETERYFGKEGQEIQKERWIEMLPKRNRK